MHSKRWIITGYDGTDKLMKFSILFGMTSEGQIVALLQRLASRHLTPEEVVAASYRKGSVGYSPLLEPLISPRPRRTIQVGSNPYYVAAIWQSGESEKGE